MLGAVDVRGDDGWEPVETIQLALGAPQSHRNTLVGPAAPATAAAGVEKKLRAPSSRSLRALKKSPRLLLVVQDYKLVNFSYGVGTPRGPVIPGKGLPA